MKLAQVRQFREKLRTHSEKELADVVVALRKVLFALRMQRATGQQPKPDQFGAARRNIARVKTALRAKHIAGGGKAK
jgi:large subunit ribosomal protein L29